MSDGTTLPGTGDKIYTEDMGSVGKVQGVKILLGDLDQNAGPVSQANPMPVMDSVALIMALEAFINAMPIDPATGRLRVLLDAVTAALTLATITTVGTVSAVTSQAQMAGIPLNSMPFDSMNNVWANTFLRGVA